MSWLRDLWSVLVRASGQPVYQRAAHNHYGPGAPTITDNQSTAATDFYYSGAPTSGAFGSLGASFGTGSPGAYQINPAGTGAGVTIVTTDGTTANLVAYPCPADKSTTINLFVTAWIRTSTTAFVYVNTALGGVFRLGTGAPISTGNPFFGTPSPAAPFAASGSPGSIGFAISGNTLELQATGIGAPSAWAAGAFTKGQLVTKSGNVYAVISIAGTGTSTSGPAGTGTTTDNAGANQVVWDYHGPGTAVTITWCPEKVEIFTP